MRARVPVPTILVVAATVVAGLFLSPAPAGAAQDTRSTAVTSSSSWVVLAADRVSSVVLDALDQAVEAAAKAAEPPPPPPPPPVSDPATWIWPGDGPITSPFGPRWGRAHTGVDIDAPTGSAVIAPQAGTVTLAGWKNGYGLTVIIDHGEGISTLNGHLSSVGVATGQVVPQGQYLGAVGATGNVTAAHLHYEVHVGGAPQNPMTWLQGPKQLPAPVEPDAPAPVLKAAPLRNLD